MYSATHGFSAIIKRISNVYYFCLSSQDSLGVNIDRKARQAFNLAWVAYCIYGEVWAVVFRRAGTRLIPWAALGSFNERRND